MKQVDLFVSTVERWMSNVQEPDSQASTQVSSALKVSDQLSEDNASVVSSVRSSRSGRSSRTSVNINFSTYLCRGRESSITCKANELQRKHAIEKEEEELRKMKEVWEVQAEIAANIAKIEYLKNAENSVTNDHVVTKGPMNVYCEEMLNKTPLSATNTQVVRPKETFHAQLSTVPMAPSVSVTSRHSYPKNSNAVQHLDLATILQKQNNLTDMLVKQQQLSTLPRGEIPVFNGDILQYRAFLHSSEHIIESKTDDNEDRLHFLIQYTRGLPQELVRSCQHMTPSRGYQKASSC